MNPATLNAALLSEALQLSEHHQAYAWATVVRATPPSSAYVGAQAIVTADGTLHGWVGGGCARGIVVQSCLEAIEHGTSKLIRISNEAGLIETDTEQHAMPCASNGALDLFIQSVNPTPVLCIAGSTHAATAAGEFAALLGWRVFYSRSSDVVEKAGALIDQPETLAKLPNDAPPPDFMLVATQGEDDLENLERALKGPAKKVLLIASTKKAASLISSMRHLGISQERLADLESPAGPDIFAETPTEVALAAVAGLVRVYRESLGAAQTRKAAMCANARASTLTGVEQATRAQEADQRVPEHDASAPALADPPAYINPVCLRAIDRETALHTISVAGETLYFCCNGCKIKFDDHPEKYLEIARNLVRPEPI